MTSYGRTARALETLATAFMLVGALSSRASAQWRSAVAVGAPTAALAANHQVDPHAIAVPNDNTWRTRDCWKWVGIGALVGAAAAGALLALDTAHDHSDDGMMLPIVGVVIVGAGGVGGGLGGALVYALAHPAPAQSP